MSEQIKIKATVYWCQHDKINEMSGKYQLNLCNLSDAAAAALEAMGVSVQVGEDKKEEMGKYITCKSANPIRIHDTDNDELVGVQIGNGSKARALVGSYAWTYKNKKGISPNIAKLVITDLVEYANTGTIDEDDLL